MKFRKVLSCTAIAIAALLASGPQLAAEPTSSATTGQAAPNFDGRYYADVNGGQLSLVLIQKGDKVLGRMDGLNNYVYELDGQVREQGLVGRMSTKGNAGFFSGKKDGARLQMVFAEADRQGRPNLAKAVPIVFSSGAPAQASSQTTPQQASGGAQRQDAAANRVAGQPTIQQCRDAWSACQNQCLRGRNDVMYKCFDVCSGQNDRCMGGRTYASSGSGTGPGSVGDIMRQQHDMHIDNMRCIGDYTKC